MSMTVVRRVDPRSPAHRAGVRAGDTLLEINGTPIVDVLDYKFYSYDPRLELTLLSSDGDPAHRPRTQGGGAGPGAGLRDLPHGPGPLLCQQLHLLLCGPDAAGMRESLYFQG